MQIRVAIAPTGEAMVGRTRSVRPIESFVDEESVISTGAIVITSIQRPTPCVRAFAAHPDRWPVILVGDRKTPDDWYHDGVHFLSLDAQRASKFQLASALPVNHYSRKNIGYLEAMRRGARIIVESDDDNMPVDWKLNELSDQLQGPCISNKAWVNVYRWFTQRRIWPRGFPLEELERAQQLPISVVAGTWHTPVQQFLASGDPDVDAVYRLTVGKADHQFGPGAIALGRGAVTPFNSQSTAWWPAAYPFLYLPSHVSFRMTDIWRSFVAQVCLWAFGAHLSYHAATVHQQRNAHDLMRDFREELPGYLNNRRIVQELSSLTLSTDLSHGCRNLHACYRRLVDLEVVPEEELRLVDLWVTDLEGLSVAAA